MTNSLYPYDPMDPYGIQREEEERKERERLQKEAEKGNDLLIVLFKLIGSILYLTFIFSSSLVAAYFILQPMKFFQSLAGWEKFVAFIAVAYLINSLIFFLKGIMMSFRVAENKLWILFWLICFVFVCLLPAVAVYFLLEQWLGPSIPRHKEGINHYQFWSAAGAIVAGAFIYNRYGLTKNKVLKIFMWAYKSGTAAGMKMIK